MRVTGVPGTLHSLPGNLVPAALGLSYALVTFTATWASQAWGVVGQQGAWALAGAAPAWTTKAPSGGWSVAGQPSAWTTHP